MVINKLVPSTHSSAPNGKVCSHCARAQTPIWRKGVNGQILCNACGLYLKQQGRMRPLDLDSRAPPKKGKKSKLDINGKTSRFSQVNADSNGSKNIQSEMDHHRPRKSKPIKLNSLPLSALPFEYGDAMEMEMRLRGPTSIYYMGRRYDLGDYVSVRGVDHPEYFGIICGFDLKCDGSKYFWMKWLIPKSKTHNSLAPPFHLVSQESSVSIDRMSSNDFCMEVTTCESMDCIKFVFDSAPLSAVLDYAPNTLASEVICYEIEDESREQFYTRIDATEDDDAVAPAEFDRDPIIESHDHAPSLSRAFRPIALSVGNYVTQPAISLSSSILADTQQNHDFKIAVSNHIPVYSDDSTRREAMEKKPTY